MSKFSDFFPRSNAFMSELIRVPGKIYKKTYCTFFEKFSSREKLFAM